MATPPKNPVRKPLDSQLAGLHRTDAARYLGVSLSTIKRFEKEGVLVPSKDKDGTNWFDMPQLETLKAERNGQAGPETEAMVATLDTAASTSASSQKHVEKLLGLVLDPSHDALEFLRSLLADVRAECDKLRTENFALLTKMADLIKADRQEAIEEMRLKQSDARKGQALGLLKQAVPMIVAQAGGNKQLGQLLGFIQSLHPEQLRILMGSGLLTEDQLGTLTQVLSEVQKTGLAAPSDTSGLETEPSESPAAP